MKILNFCFTLFLLFAFCSGIYVIMNDTFKIEPMTNNSSFYCPDTLAEKDGFIMLYNSEYPHDHITFNNLEEYNNFITIQNENGIYCPKLDLKIVNDDDNHPKPVIDSSDDNHPFNSNNYKSFDPYGLQIGVYTELDKIHDSFDFKKLPHDSSNWVDIETTTANYDRNVLIPEKYGDKSIEIIPYGSSSFDNK